MGNQRSVLSDVQLDDRAGLVNTAGSDSTTHDPEPAGAMPMRKRGTLDEMSDEDAEGRIKKLEAKYGPQECRNNALYGSCKHGDKCRNNHPAAPGSFKP